MQVDPFAACPFKALLLQLLPSAPSSCRGPDHVLPAAGTLLAVAMMWYPGSGLDTAAPLNLLTCFVLGQGCCSTPGLPGAGTGSDDK